MDIKESLLLIIEIVLRVKCSIRDYGVIKFNEQMYFNAKYVKEIIKRNTKYKTWRNINPLIVQQQ